MTTSGNLHSITVKNAIQELSGDHVLISTGYLFEIMEELLDMISMFVRRIIIGALSYKSYLKKSIIWEL